MNKDNARDYLPLVQALADGKTIQINRDSDGDWEDYTADKIIFDGPASDYRIKPEPREIWVNEWKTAGKVVFDSAEEAAEHARRYGINHSTTLYREVIE